MRRRVGERILERKSGETPTAASPCRASYAAASAEFKQMCRRDTIHAVIANGRSYDRPALDAMLSALKLRAGP
jgi:hypothetical protein